jgi:hypothetical protein
MTPNQNMKNEISQFDNHDGDMDPMIVGYQHSAQKTLPAYNSSGGNQQSPDVWTNRSSGVSLSKVHLKMNTSRFSQGYLPNDSQGIFAGIKTRGAHPLETA